MKASPEAMPTKNCNVGEMNWMKPSQTSEIRRAAQENRANGAMVSGPDSSNRAVVEGLDPKWPRPCRCSQNT